MPKQIKYYILYTVSIISLLILIYKFDLYLKGYFTYQIIVWIWLIFTLYIVINHRKLTYIKIYALTLLSLIIASIAAMGIPFIVFVSFLFNIDKLQTIKLNDEYELRITKQVLAKKTIYIDKTDSKLLIFEEINNIKKVNYEDVVSRTLQINEDDPKLYEYENSPIQNAKLINVSTDNIGIEYQILNKKKIIYHNLNETSQY